MTFVQSQQPVRMGFQPTGLELAVMEENSHQLLSRHALAQSGQHLITKNFFFDYPGQGNLFEILSQMSRAEVVALANTAVPIFAISHSSGQFSKAALPSGAPRRADRDEIMAALLTRQEGYRRNRLAANILFQLDVESASWLTRQSPLKIQSISDDPLWAIKPVLNARFFKLGAGLLDDGKRTALAAMSRSHLQ